MVLDRDSHTLHLPGRDVVDAGFADAVLQIPGESSESVTLATPTELLVVPLQDAEIQRISSGASSKGVTVAPVVLGGCRYAAWAGVGRYVRAVSYTHLDVYKRQTRTRPCATSPAWPRWSRS